MCSGRSLLLPGHSAAHRVASPFVEIQSIGWKYGINVRRPGVKRDRIEIDASVSFLVSGLSLLESVLGALAERMLPSTT